MIQEKTWIVSIIPTYIGRCAIIIDVHKSYIYEIWLYTCISFRLYLLRYFSFYEPSADIVSGERAVPFKEKVTLLTVDPYRVTIPLSPGSGRCGRPYIGDTVDFIFMSVFPCDLSWKHNAIVAKADNHIHIYFYIVHGAPPTDYNVRMVHNPLQ